MTTQHDDRPSALHGAWTGRDGDWTYTRTQDPRSEKPQSFPEDPAVNRAMAGFTAERGYLNLSQAHELAAKDCPRGCACRGCESTRREREAEKAAKATRAVKRRRETA